MDDELMITENMKQLALDQAASNSAMHYQSMILKPVRRGMWHKPSHGKKPLPLCILTAKAIKLSAHAQLLEETSWTVVPRSGSMLSTLVGSSIQVDHSRVLAPYAARKACHRWSDSGHNPQQ